MMFGESISTCLKKYFVFEGRASKSEYWWFQLIVTPSYIISTIGESIAISYFFWLVMELKEKTNMETTL